MSAEQELPKLKKLLEQLLERQDLDEPTAASLLISLTNLELPPALSGGLLVALRSKGVTAAELRGFAQAMRSLARQPRIDPALRAAAVDLVGTGGDASGSFNLSTGAALLLAACGVPVIKHGNRSISSRCGSADVLEALGLRLPLDEREAGDCLAATGFTFLFAPHYHPAMKAIAPVRAALGVRTIFNVLGPLTNPAAPPYAVVGAYSAAMAELMAQSLLGTSELRRAFVIHGAAGWDEPTPLGPFTMFDIGFFEAGAGDAGAARVRTLHRDPLDYGLPRCTVEDLRGGDAAHNAAELAAVLRGERLGAHRDALVLGVGLALEVTGKESDLAAGIARAARAIDDGAAAALLARLDAFGRRRGGATPLGGAIP